MSGASALTTLADFSLPEPLNDWLAYTAELPVPKVFRLWTGLSMFGSVLERKVWMRSAGQFLYPNLYVLLVAPPGVGKSFAMMEARELLAQAGNTNLAPASMTGKGLVDELLSESAQKKFTYKQKVHFFRSTNIIISELGTMLKEYDLQQTSILNDLFDCGAVYQERTRGGGYLQIERPHVSIMAGTQPAYLAKIFPEAAFGMGLTSRVLMIYSNETVVPQIFKEEVKPAELRTKTVGVLKVLGELAGQYVIEDSTKTLIQDWINAGAPPKPTHHRLQHYNARRVLHCLKLTMIFGALYHGDLIITDEAFLAARASLLEFEKEAPKIFLDMVSDSDVALLKELESFLLRKYRATKAPVKENELYSFLSGRIPAWQIKALIETFSKSKMAVQTPEGFIPGQVAGASPAAALLQKTSQ
jgi:hypothetical protein